MSDYKASTVSGSRWWRAQRVIVENPYGRTPYVSYAEQEIVLIDSSDKVVRDVGMLSTEFDPDQEFPILNPETGEATGETAKMRDVYVLLHSHYIFAAKQRDERLAAANTATVE